MNKIDFEKLTRRFLLGEGKENPSLQGYIQSLFEIIGNIKPQTKTNNNRLSIAKTHLREIRKLSRRLEEKVQLLEEQLKVLEEGK